MWSIIIGLVVILAVLGGGFFIASCTRKAAPLDASAIPEGVHSFTLTANDGTPHPLQQYQGKTVLLVNTASKCGYTTQYEGMQDLHDRYADKGLVVIAVPSNDFLGQEPGSNEDIAEFCRVNFQTEFPLMAKVHVTGDKAAPLYRYLVNHSPFPGKISWNFNKFLIGPDGSVINRFGTGTKPESDEVTAAIEESLDS